MSAIRLNLEQSKILSSGNGLTAKTKFWTGQTVFTEYVGECNTYFMCLYII